MSVLALPLRDPELCERRGGRPGLPDPNGPYGLCGRKATLNNHFLHPTPTFVCLFVFMLFFVCVFACLFVSFFAVVLGRFDMG